ncbi:Spermidine Putrescine ABC transporter permease component potCD [Mesoplasma florum W37]|uniref:Spermidine Putrescine ABC transporter permease component potC, ABC transporter, periplasmic spermidine putrescine-binding protein PotD n=1 Tax=Mesoplasma florum TaxID=2151 RepID=A0AAD0HS55_MESFO|nr:spermidine/putrescine ABC transporter permease/substrate-binding protein [Mesoplasma florum]AGY41605.1 Spermidine Putrescine ABC transporter permease component potCD [Mesoplasma florum W37]AVN59816.1 spermidine/putrescine ABC transporter permease [Mesoplasma florum]AVN65943.1 Spermidine Putrescine ABC transporter permease component potC, ABC transporter, periplasmic spermidine putrescine-binding protein PotD [Mesoplasma florum]
MKRFVRSTYFALILLVIYVPIGIMVLFSFNSGSSVSNWMGFSTRWYEEFFKNSPFIKSIITSLFVAVVSTMISVVIGVMAAIGLSRLTKRKQSKWMSIANIPLINADIITAVALMVVFLICGLKFGILTLIMAHVSFNVPYVLITVMPRLRKVDKSIVEASYDLGAKTSTVIFKIILPILKPAIIIATIIAFAMSFDDFIISYFTGGAQTNVASFIYSAKRIKPYIFAFGTMMVGIIAAGVIIWNAFLFAQDKKETTKLQIKNGTYKTKEIYKLEKEIQMLTDSLNTGTKRKISFNLSIWFKFYVLKFKLKIANSKNYDKKIAKLEWKRYKLQNTINREKRYGARLKKAIAKQKQLEKQLSKTTDIKKAAKISIQLEKIEEKVTFLSEEVAWLNEKEKEAKEKAASINKKIKQLKKEFKAEIDPSKSTINWYNKKIKYYEEWKIEVEEGKNNFKLRMIVEKLKDIKQINENKINDLASRLDLVATQAFRKVSVTSKINNKISKNPNDKELINLKNEAFVKFETKQNNLIKAKDEKVTHIKLAIAKQKEKYFPTNIDEANFTKGFFARSWKVLLVSLLFLVSFTGLTVAFVMNNIYDLVIGNWGEYIDPSLIKEFEKEYNVKVNYQEYDSNETLYNKLYTFNYDLMVPSDYMVQKLAEEGKLEPLDYSRINAWSEEFGDFSEGINKNKKPSEEFTAKTQSEQEAEALQISDELLDIMYKSKVNYSESEEYEETQLGTGSIIDYAIPYLWGDLVIAVNPNSMGTSRTSSNPDAANIKWLLETHPETLLRKLKSGEEAKWESIGNNTDYDKDYDYAMNNSELSWRILWDAAAAGKEVVLNEDPKNVYAMAGQILYGTGNLTKQSQIDAATKELAALLSYKKVGLQGDSLIQSAAEGRFDFAVMYNGDLSYANVVYNGEDTLETDEDDDTYSVQPKADEDENKVYFLYGRPNAEVEGVNGEKPTEEDAPTHQTTNIYSDNMVMSKYSTHKDIAYDFINFFIAHAEDISDSTGTPTGFVETLASATAAPVDGEEEGTYYRYADMFKPIILQEGSGYKDTWLQPFFNNELDPKLIDAYNTLRAGKN